MTQFDNLTKEQRWYQMGEECIQERDSQLTQNERYALIAAKYGYSSASVRHFEDYVRAINRIRAVASCTAETLLEGRISLSINKTEFLSRQTADKIEAALPQLANPKTRFNDIFPDYKDRRAKEYKSKKSIATVKDMPAYDPDAQVAGLTYTIPSWTDVMDRVRLNADFNAVTVGAHRGLKKALENLKTAAETMLNSMTEEAK